MTMAMKMSPEFHQATQACFILGWFDFSFKILFVHAVCCDYLMIFFISLLCQTGQEL